jgi:hypothetical protein
MILARFDGPGALKCCPLPLPWLYGIGRVQVIGTLGASTAIAIHGETYSQRLRSSRRFNMKNRLSQYDLSEDDQEDYEIWADALFEVAYNQPNDVGTLVFGPSRENGLEDFSLTQTKAQQKRLRDNFKDRRN